MSSKSVSQIFLISGMTAILLNSEGLKSWADGLDVGIARELATGTTSAIYSAFDSIGLTEPRRRLRQAFFQFKKNYHPGSKANHSVETEVASASSVELQNTVSNTHVSGPEIQLTIPAGGARWRLLEMQLDPSRNPRAYKFLFFGIRC